jgi:hypothetical protein
MATWVQVGYTFYNDRPPGAGDLRYGGYSFAELGTATRAGVATGIGNLGHAFGVYGEEPMGSVWSLYLNGKVVQARKEDRGYGQGGDGTHSDPHYAVDLYDGSRWGLPNLRGALGAGGSGTVWIRRGAWHPPEALPSGRTAPPPDPLRGVTGSVAAGEDPPDHSPKVRATGKKAGEAGSQFQGHARAMQHLARRQFNLK